MQIVARGRFQGFFDYPVFMFLMCLCTSNRSTGPGQAHSPSSDQRDNSIAFNNIELQIYSVFQLNVGSTINQQCHERTESFNSHKTYYSTITQLQYIKTKLKRGLWSKALYSVEDLIKLRVTDKNRESNTCACQTIAQIYYYR